MPEYFLIFCIFFKCYIQYMRFLRRAEGIRSARTIFKKAREDTRSSYHVYIAAAFMEYYCTKVCDIRLIIIILFCSLIYRYFKG